MKRIIDGKRYDTETADWVAAVGSDTCSVTDFGYWEAALCRTPRGRWFLAGKGGGMTMFAESVGGGGSRGGEGIIPIPEREARDHLERDRFGSDDSWRQSALERWFAIEEA